MSEEPPEKLSTREPPLPEYGPLGEDIPAPGDELPDIEHDEGPDEPKTELDPDEEAAVDEAIAELSQLKTNLKQMDNYPGKDQALDKISAAITEKTQEVRLGYTAEKARLKAEQEELEKSAREQKERYEAVLAEAFEKATSFISGKSDRKHAEYLFTVDFENRTQKPGVRLEDGQVTVIQSRSRILDRKYIEELREQVYKLFRATSPSDDDFKYEPTDSSLRKGHIETETNIKDIVIYEKRDMIGPYPVPENDDPSNWQVHQLVIDLNRITEDNPRGPRF